MANRTASHDKSYVGSSRPGLKSDRVRKFRTLCQLCGSKRRELRSCPDCGWDVTPVGLASEKTFQAALGCGLSRRQAAELVAATMAAGVTAAQSPLARAVVQVECETKTRSLVMAIRERNARGKVAA